MKSHLTKTEANAFKARWAAVNRAELEELRAATLDEKIGQLAALMSSVEKMGWSEALASEASEVRERWSRLRKAYRA